jgi:chromosome segregation ATPase
VLRHLLNDRLELESAKANRLANELEASRAECAAERAETEKVRAMLSNKLRRLDERVAAKQEQIDALEAEKQGVLATLQERSDQLVDAQAELFLSEAKKVG